MKKILGVSSVLLLSCSLSFAGAFKSFVSSISPSQPTVQSGGLTISVVGQFSNGSKVELCGGACSFRATRRVSNSQLLVDLLPGDLSIEQTYVVYVTVKPGSNVTSPFFWHVSDGTIVISPESASVPFGQQFQFSATSTLAGDTIQWGLQTCTTFQPPASIDETGLFTAPASLSNSLCAPGSTEQVGIVASSTLDPSKYSLAMATIK